MAVKPELLNRGLWSIIDPSMMPEGALQETANARYHPGDPAIWQAEGRAAAGTGWDLISSVGGLVWDTGTIVLPSKPGLPDYDPQLKQIIYVRDGNLYTVKAAEVPTDPALNFAQSTLFAPPAGTGVGTDPIVPIQFKNEYHLLTGGKTVVMFRTPSTGQGTRRAGFPLQLLKPTIITSGGAGDYNVAKGFHFWWFTWYDAANDIESDVDPDLAVAFYRATSSAVGRWDILIDFASFDAAVPPGATGIRIYKTLPFYPDQAFGSLTPPANPWPVGYRLPYLADTTKSYVPFLVNANGSRFPISAGSYVLLLWGTTASPSTAENENHLSDFPLFPFGTISVGGIQVNFGINGEPPKSNTGDVFEESLVTNDLANKRNIRFSMPNNADQFPEEYFIPFDTSETDEVLAIRRLGNKLGVFLRQGVWRVEWLPSQSEFDFSRGRVMDEVQGATGAVGAPHYSVAKFNMPGQGPMLAWVSRTGYIYATNLYDVTKLCPQFCLLHIPNSVERTTFSDMPLDNLKIFDDPDNERLVVQTDAFLWYLHYDEAHIHDGALDVTGPVFRAQGISAYGAATVEGGRKQLISISTAKAPFYEALGYSDGSISLNTSVTTREVYPAGLGEELESQSFFVHSKPALGSGTITLNVTSSTETSDVDKSKIFPAGPRALVSMPHVTLLERYRVNLTVNGVSSPIALNYVGLELDEEREKLS